MTGAVSGHGPATGTGFSFARVGAMVLRHWYLLRGSWPRLLDLVYWPIVQMLMWGFLSQYMATTSSVMAGAFGILLAGVLLWDVCLRSEITFSMAMLEEMWSRNLGHLFVSPLKPSEWALAMAVTAGLKTTAAIIPAMLLCIPLFAYDIFAMGPAFIAFYASLLLTGWSFGLIAAAIVLRMGLGAENIVWGMMFLIAPASCIYYPVATLPPWLQPVALALPTTPVFEGMRALVIDAVFRPDLLLHAFALNVVYLTLAFALFLRVCAIIRRRGLILQQGE